MNDERDTPQAEPVVSEQPATPPVDALATKPARGSLLITRLIQALWLGSGAFLIFIAAPAAFRGANNAGEAANIVGVMLTRWHYLALLAPLLLMIFEWRRNRPRMLIILFLAIILASMQALIDTRIRIMRMSSPIPISSLDPADPFRRNLGKLHGISSLLLLGEVAAAAAAVAMHE